LRNLPTKFDFLSFAMAQRTSDFFVTKVFIFIPLLLLSSCNFSLAATLATNVSCWKQFSPLPMGRRAEHGAAAIGNKIYIVGGMATTGAGYPNVTLLNTEEVYDTTTDQWSAATSSPMKIHHPNVVAVSGELYVLGGISTTPANLSGSATFILETAYKLDSRSGAWIVLSSMPSGTGRGASAIGVYGKVVYLAGGTQQVGKTALDIVSTYDTEQDRWTTLPIKLPEARDHVGGTVVGDMYYVVGRRHGLQAAVRGTVFVLNLTAPELKWTTLSSVPTPRGSLPLAVVGKKIYTFGGEGNPDNSSQGVFPQNEIYDVERDSWSKDAPMRTPKHGAMAVAIGEAIYIPRGSASKGSRLDLNITEVYRPSGRC
jgi:N-acetylneuraminic acid mutarotase